MAEQMADEMARRAMLEIADKYEKIAQRDELQTRTLPNA
jgi:hypothetical protein